jgi:heavy metal translocating P-type ATPase
MEQKLKKAVLTICLTLALSGWISGSFGLLNSSIVYYLELSSALVALVAIAYGAIRTLMDGIFGIDVLATFAVLASIAGGEFLPAAVVALMLLGGEMLENYAQRRASRAIEKLIEAQPQTALVIREGQEVQVKSNEVHFGEVVLVKPGAKVPVDGIILKGHASINQASVTGESIPVDRFEGDIVYSGSVVLQGAIYVSATAVGESSTYGRLVLMVKEAESKRAPIVRVADRYARIFTPAIMVLGLIIYAFTGDLLRVAAVFIIACPCALTIATPTAIVASIGNAARKGILIRNGESLEKLAKVNTLVLDKTGTLTEGKLEITDIQSFGTNSVGEILRFAALAEKCSEHPFAKAILEKATEEKLAFDDPECFEHFPGLGVHAGFGSDRITVGNLRLMEKNDIAFGSKANIYLSDQQAQTVVFVAKGVEVLGAISLADRPRRKVKETIDAVKATGVKKVIVLTGDNRFVAKAVAEASGIEDAVSEMMPIDKARWVSDLRDQGFVVAMVGDGVNDAPALAEADVGIAMGLTGTDVAMETAAVTLATDDLSKLPTLIKIGKRTFGVIKQNIAFALAVNIVGIFLSTQGWVSPLAASIIHESNALLVMLNSLRLLKVN